MAAYLPYLQIIFSILLVTGILFQRSEAGLGSAFGMETTNTRYTRRGLERIFFHGTIIVAILFSASVFASLVVGR